MGEAAGLPFLAEFLLCAELGWSWHDLMATPAPVLAYWALYRQARATAALADRDAGR